MMGEERVVIRFEAVVDESGHSKLKAFRKTMTEVHGTKMIKSVREINEQTGRWRQTTKEITEGYKGFRMELLSTMFAGMALARGMQTLTQPAMEAFGIYDMFQATLLDLMAPAMEEVADLAISISDQIMGMSEEEKLAAGRTILLAQGFGNIIYVLSQAGLAVGGFQTVLSQLGGGQFGLSMLWQGLMGGPKDKETLLANEPFLLKVATKGVGFLLMLDGIDTLLSEDDISGQIKGLAQTSLGAGLLLGGKEGKYLFGVAFGLGLVSLATTEEFDFKTALETILPAAVVAGMKWGVGGAAAGIAFTVGWALVLVDILDPEHTVGEAFTDIISKFTDPFLTAFDLPGIGKEYRRSPMGPQMMDFISRPGSPPISFSPNDTIMGTKGGLGSNVTIYNNITASISSNIDMEELAGRIGDIVSRDVEASMVR